MRKNVEYCCNSTMLFFDQLLVRDNKFMSIVTVYQCRVCKVQRGWLLRQLNDNNEWDTPVKVGAKKIIELTACMVTSLKFKETRATTHASEATKKMSRNTI